MQDKKNEYNYISLLKGIAILGVILVHSPLLIPNINKYIPVLLHFGAFGCQLFFLISGFLMVGSFERLLNKNKDKKTAIMLFLKKRYVSIAPIYIMFVLFYQIITLFIEANNLESFYRITHNVNSILLNCCLLHGVDYIYINHVIPGGWFIGTIFLFYLLFPCIYWVFKSIEKYDARLTWLIPLVIILINISIQFIIFTISNNWEHLKPSTYMYYSILNQLPCMLFGMILNQKIYNKKHSHDILCFIIIFVICNISYILFRKYYFVYAFVPSFVGFSFYFLFRYFQNTEFVKDRIYLISVVQSCGNLSFSAYFTNFLAAFIFPWGLSLLLNIYGIRVNGDILYIVLIVPIFILTFLLAIPLNKIIVLTSRIFD